MEVGGIEMQSPGIILVMEEGIDCMSYQNIVLIHF
jgi:hypothetical protein